jgi:hypothetical protein
MAECTWDEKNRALGIATFLKAPERWSIFNQLGYFKLDITLPTNRGKIAPLIWAAARKQGSCHRGAALKSP